METPENEGRAAQKTQRVGRAPADSGESESEQVDGDAEEARKSVSPVRKDKKREKSRRRREKEKKRSRVVEKLKKKERFSVSKHFLVLFFHLSTGPLIHLSCLTLAKTFRKGSE